MNDLAIKIFEERTRDEKNIILVSSLDENSEPKECISFNELLKQNKSDIDDKFANIDFKTFNI